jgi:DNA anti-recombination protein RmuC
MQGILLRAYVCLIFAFSTIGAGKAAPDLNKISSVPGSDFASLRDAVTNGLFTLNAELSKKIAEEVGGLRREMNERFDRADGKLSAEIGGLRREMNERFDKADDRLTKAEERLSGQVGKVDERLSDQVGKLDERLSGEFGGLRREMGERFDKADDKADDRLTKSEERLSGQMGKTEARLASEISGLRREMGERSGKTDDTFDKTAETKFSGQVGKLDDKLDAIQTSFNTLYAVMAAAAVFSKLSAPPPADAMLAALPPAIALLKNMPNPFKKKSKKPEK